MDNEQHSFFDILQKEIDNNSVSHAYLIELGDYNNIDFFIKKTTKMLLCSKKKYKNDCEDCNICSLVDHDNYPDLKIIDVDGNYIKKEQLVTLKDAFAKESMYGNKQIYVIKDASKLNSSSGNTILKFLEEPNSDIVAILLAKNRYNVLETIVSRCQVFKLNDSNISSYNDDLEELVNTLFAKDKGFLAYNEIIEFMPDRNVFYERVRVLQRYLLEIINGKQKKNELLSKKSDDKIAEIILIIEKYLERCEYNINYKLLLDNFLVDISEVM